MQPVGNSAEEGQFMSKKRKLESLAQLGVLKDSDVKAIQSKLEYRVEPYRLSWHNVRWTSLAVVLTLSYGALAIVIATGWKLSH